MKVNAHMAMTLFAMHQQGNNPRNKPMSMPGREFHLGSAVRKLVTESGGEDAEAPIKRRFDAAVTSESPEELYRHLRGIIQLLRSKYIPLDYPQLADDLLNFQNPDRRDGVRLKWGRSYYYQGKDEEKE
jgi:CRISPR type I-E-associated protein CasB/Cse2